MDVEIISIGDEVLRGQTVNGNAAFLSHELTERGYTICRHTVLSDDIEAIRSGLQEALHRSSFVITTGGLGPTLDDLTRVAAAPFFKEKPEELKNELGTAPGAFGSHLILLPGVPREMERMFLEETMPLILERYPLDKPYHIRSCTLCLLRELEVDPILKKLEAPGLKIGIYPAYGSLQIVFRSQRSVDDLIRKVQEQFPTFYVGRGSIEEAVHREMIARKKTLALAESCTGGAIAARLARVPDASLYFLGSIVAYSNQWKERFLGVRHDTLSKHGAVSGEAVEEMIQGHFDETECDFAVAVSGILGPKGGSAQKPVGTIYIAVAERGKIIDIGRLSAPKDRKAGTWPLT